MGIRHDVEAVKQMIGSRDKSRITLERKADFRLDLRSADLPKAQFLGADLSNAMFHNSNLPVLKQVNIAFYVTGAVQPAAGRWVYPYLLRDLTITRPNQAWAADITYLPMTRGFLYLVAIMDWHSRYVVAWRLSNTLEADFCVDALKEALGQGQPEVFNTDQGSQFTSLEFTQVLQEHGVKISMDGKGRYNDNIFVERLWRTVKCEEVYLKAYANASEARRELGAYFRYYNDQRPHQALGYRTPAEVFHQVTDVGEERAVQAKKSPIDQTLVSLAGAAGLSLNSTSVLSN